MYLDFAYCNLLILSFSRQDNGLVRQTLSDILSLHDPYDDGCHCCLSVRSAQTKTGLNNLDVDHSKIRHIDSSLPLYYVLMKQYPESLIYYSMTNITGITTG